MRMNRDDGDERRLKVIPTRVLLDRRHSDDHRDARRSLARCSSRGVNLITRRRLEYNKSLCNRRRVVHVRYTIARARWSTVGIGSRRSHRVRRGASLERMNYKLAVGRACAPDASALRAKPMSALMRATSSGRESNLNSGRMNPHTSTRIVSP